MTKGSAQVIGRRTSRLALAGSVPNARDQREFALMSHEKGEAAIGAGRERTHAQQRPTEPTSPAKVYIGYGFPCPITVVVGQGFGRALEQTLSMLVTFHTNAATSITMFGDFALELLKYMGHSGSVPGALIAEDVPSALARLREKVCETSDIAETTITNQTPNHPQPTRHVQCRQYAYPLVELLTAAARDHCDVIWEKGIPPI